MAQIRRYDIIEELGRGGFATVYKARDTQLNRLVALKMLHHSFSSDPAFAHRFQQEAETLANLRHPNIVVIYDVGDIGQQLFIAMEYLEGRNLHQWLGEVGLPFTIAQALPILEPLGSALDYAHKKGIVHRDIKPNNVMIDESGGSQRFVLTDFGLVKAMENTIAVTRTGQTLGSPEYMAPEQADPNRRDELGPPTDRYAFGIMAYQILTGRVPFPGNSISTLFAHLNLDVPSPQEINKELTDEAVACLLKMLAKAPDDRFDSCADFVAALSGSPPPGPEEQLAELYEQLLQATVDKDWMQVLMLGGRIRELNPTYRDVAGQVARAQETLSQRRNRESAPPVAPKPGHRKGKTGVPVSVKDKPDDVWVHPKTGKEMVRIPAGPFLFGKGLLFGKGKDKRELPEFWIDKTPVTNAQYALFVAATGYKPPKHWKTGGLFGFGKQEQKEPPAELTDHPVVNVSWEDANAYAEWAGGSLPSEEQWEKAARGTDGREYPWGDKWQDGRCNTKEAGIGTTTPVGQFSPDGDSPYGCVDMSGNVWEWTSTKEGGAYIIKGGVYYVGKDKSGVAARSGHFIWQVNGGFRIVAAAPSSPSVL